MLEIHSEENIHLVRWKRVFWEGARGVKVMEMEVEMCFVLSLSHVIALTVLWPSQRIPEA